MRNYNYLTIEQKEIIVRLSNSNLSLRKIAHILQCSHTCIWKTIKSFQSTNSFELEPNSGRKKISTYRDDRKLTSLLQKKTKKLPFHG
jgi:MarR-like DNA-binding transcriptional regulator SgrR of sgrS sRNA